MSNLTKNQHGSTFGPLPTTSSHIKTFAVLGAPSQASPFFHISFAFAKEISVATELLWLLSCTVFVAFKRHMFTINGLSCVFNAAAACSEHFLTGCSREHGRPDRWLLPTGRKSREIAHDQT